MLIESVTNLGLIRKNNEDRFLTKTFESGAVLLALADGMGGHAGGEVAAQMALDMLGHFDPASDDPRRDLVQAVHNAHKSIIEASRFDKSLKGMGTTLTAIFISGAAAWWIQVGDSRLYILRGGLLRQITSDDTIPGTLLKKGEISKEQARLHPYGNFLLKCVGCHRFEPETGTLRLEAGDQLMLSSDGLHDLIPDIEIEALLAQDISPRNKLDRLVEKCLDAGGKDNITGVLAKI